MRIEMLPRRYLVCMFLPLVSFLLRVPCCAEPVDFYVVWRSQEANAGQLQVTNGRIHHIETYRFDKTVDKITDSTIDKLKWQSGTSDEAKGIHVFADLEENATVSYQLAAFTGRLTFSEIRQKGLCLDPANTAEHYLIVGTGSPAKGPEAIYQQKLPPIYQGPTPQDVLGLPDTWQDAPVCVFLSTDISDPSLRRQSANDGKLYVELFSEDPVNGTAHVKIQENPIGKRNLEKSLWFSVNPKIGMLSVEVVTPSKTHHLSCPATLVETRGNRLFLNGEPFLMKGILPRNLNDADAEYIRNLCINTIRGKEAIETAQKYGFMMIASIHKGLKKLTSYSTSTADANFEKDYAVYLNTIDQGSDAAIKSPYTLIIQLENEKALGRDPWSDLLGPQYFIRLNQVLAGAYNLVKPKDPMLPLGYANHSLGYVAPMFLDVYMHNTYLDKDRYGFPLETYMGWQSCDRRPFVNSEFGANRYTPQAYHGGENNPVLEKIHAWNFPNRWKEYMDAGTVGGVIYCLYDLEKPWDQGASRFGILTYDRQPKLACWEVGHLWRDFEVTPDSEQAPKKLTIEYKRNYWARNCSLQLDFDQQQKTLVLDDFAPQSLRQVELPGSVESFRWTMHYTTHGGLKMVAKGAYPVSVEQTDFLDSLSGRKYADFLKELFDAEVVTVLNQPAPATLTEMKVKHDLIPIAFRKPNGTVYLTAFSVPPVSKAIPTKSLTSRRLFRGDVSGWTSLPVPNVGKTSPFRKRQGVLRSRM